MPPHLVVVVSMEKKKQIDYKKIHHKKTVVYPTMDEIKKNSLCLRDRPFPTPISVRISPKLKGLRKALGVKS